MTKNRSSYCCVSVAKDYCYPLLRTLFKELLFIVMGSHCLIPSNSLHLIIRHTAKKGKTLKSSYSLHKCLVFCHGWVKKMWELLLKEKKLAHQLSAH